MAGSRGARRRPAAASTLLAAVLLVAIPGCDLLSLDGSPAASSSAGPSFTPSAGASSTSRPTASPVPTTEPPLSLALPAEFDSRQLRVTVTPALPADGSGEVMITVVSLTETIVQELVLRWPTDLKQTILLAPFEPSQQRIREGGPPLYQQWTKWVEGPGESGEPAGTTSLGWGPLLPGATLEIPILATRVAPGPVSFDLQLLAGEAILILDDGTPAELRLELP